MVARAPLDLATLDPAELDLTAHGAALHRGAAKATLPMLEAVLARLPTDRPGLRLIGVPGLAELLETGALAACVRAAVPDARPVRAILFDKTAATNWSLAWHQDWTIAVRARHDVPGYGPWTRKEDIQHVEPPFAIIEDMRTIRIHLDPVPADNAPLLIAPGSHRCGRIAESRIAETVAKSGALACLAERGDVWSYATAILHGSRRGTGRGRRVLQVDYSARTLPAPLAWLGL